MLTITYLQKLLNFNSIKVRLELPLGDKYALVP